MFLLTGWAVPGENGMRLQAKLPCIVNRCRRAQKKKGGFGKEMKWDGRWEEAWRRRWRDGLLRGIHTLSFASRSSILCTLFDLCRRGSSAGFCMAIILDRVRAPGRGAEHVAADVRRGGGGSVGVD